MLRKNRTGLHFCMGIEDPPTSYGWGGEGGGQTLNLLDMTWFVGNYHCRHHHRRKHHHNYYYYHPHNHY